MSKLLVFALALIAVSISQALSASNCLRTSDMRGSDPSGTYTDFRNASFRNVNLSGANFAHANLAGADVTGAAMLTTALNGTDLTRVKGLTQNQLDRACGDGETKVPVGMKVHRCV